MSQEDFKIFQYTRSDKITGEIKFSAEVIVKGFDVICFGETKVPAGISDAAAMAFFDEAEKAALKKIEYDLDNKVGG